MTKADMDTFRLIIVIVFVLSAMGILKSCRENTDKIYYDSVNQCTAAGGVWSNLNYGSCTPKKTE